MVTTLMNDLKIIFTLFLSLFLLLGCNNESNLSLSEHSVIYCSEGSPETHWQNRGM